ncbi:uncharacterized protein LOC116207153 [Punica granatum]|uniref:Uncharacterized protein n=2 Tax=Punica granatum TaxID=22663 RepID=A0A218XBC1_PUNGR|nr:uncharacterized protein LOC116207153 [Punica granatum]OWM82088.1 hypothetical protein CDL15_Pgr001662 [Punica granatum]PKI44863.1 hypothetical protein CRG98_034811 [Punica granatum]
MASKNKKGKLIRRFIGAPLRFLTRARDFYIQSLTDCSGHMSMGCPTGQVIATLPKSFSISSSRSYPSSHDEDFRELMRAASAKSLSSIKKYETLDPPNEFLRPRGQSPNLMPRSFSTGIGRIDEEKAFEFGEDIKVKTDSLYPRSRSCAVKFRSSRLL